MAQSLLQLPFRSLQSVGDSSHTRQTLKLKFLYALKLLPKIVDFSNAKITADNDAFLNAPVSRTNYRLQRIDAFANKLSLNMWFCSFHFLSYSVFRVILFP